jgi:hypothetical protein
MRCSTHSLIPHNISPRLFSNGVVVQRIHVVVAGNRGFFRGRNISQVPRIRSCLSTTRSQAWRDITPWTATTASLGPRNAAWGGVCFRPTANRTQQPGGFRVRWNRNSPSNCIASSRNCANQAKHMHRATNEVHDPSLHSTVLHSTVYAGIMMQVY